MNTKICTKCLIEKPVEAFGIHKKCKGGLNPRCKECCREQDSKWKQNNPERKRELDRKWQEANPERNKEKKRKWRQANPELVKKTKQEWRQANAEHEKKIQQKHYIAAYNGQKGPLRQLKIRIRCLVGSSIRHQSYSKTSHTHQLLGCSYQELLSHLGPKPEGDYHLDHICPCSQAQNEEELIKLQHYTNLRWIQAYDNIIKSNSRTIEAEQLCLQLLQREWKE